MKNTLSPIKEPTEPPISAARKGAFSISSHAAFLQGALNSNSSIIFARNYYAKADLTSFCACVRIVDLVMHP
jgi:hypothetical protein